MFDRFGGFVRQQVALGGIGDVSRLVDEDMIPRLVLGGLGFIGSIPFLVCLAKRITGDDHAPISIAFVLNQITGLKARRFRVGSI